MPSEWNLNISIIGPTPVHDDRLTVRPLPNPDGSFTCTHFMSFDVFEETYSVEGWMNFMRREFPDSIELFGENLRAQVKMSTCKSQAVIDCKIRWNFNLSFSSVHSLKTLPLVTVKYSRHNMSNSVIVGYSSQEKVAFYGRGMDTGMEDIETLQSCWNAWPCDL